MGTRSSELLYTVANPTRGLLNRGKKMSGSAPPTTPARAARSEKEKKKKWNNSKAISCALEKMVSENGVADNQFSNRIFPSTRFYLIKIKKYFSPVTLRWSVRCYVVLY